MRPEESCGSKRTPSLRWLTVVGLLVLPVLLSAQRAGQPLPERGPEPIVDTPAPPVETGQPAPLTKTASTARTHEYVPGEVLVRFRSGTPKDWVQIAHGVVRGKVLREYSTLEGLQLVRIPTELSVEEAVKLYQRQPEVLYAEPNYLVHAHPTDPNDTWYFAQWNLKNTGSTGGVVDADIDAPEAWDIETGSSSVEVVVIDTGVDHMHPDLIGNMVQLEGNCNDGLDNDGSGFADDCRGIDTRNNDSDPMDDNGHGTHVSGIIGAVGNNNSQIAGVAWDVGLIGCKFLPSSGTGGNIADAVDCLNYVATLKDNGRNIIATNNSWGGGSFSQALLDAIQGQFNRGILFIAAAGNFSFENNTLPEFPASYNLPNVISVAATNDRDGRSSFSNFGRQTVHVGAPGGEIGGQGPPITSTATVNMSNDGIGSQSGTSQATPHVTGVAALLKSNNGSLDYRAIKNILLSSGDTIPSLQRITVTGKRLNAHKALTCSNSEVNARQLPVGNPVRATLGVPVTLATLHINCANPAGDVQVMVSPGNQNVTLLDNGLGQDQVAGDGIYTAQWTPSINSPSTLTFPGGDVVRVYLSSISYTSSQPMFSYRNITGTNLNLVDDSVTKITPPFPIQFGGTTFPELFVASNGSISLSGPFIDFNNFSLPDIASQVTVFPFWDDLVATGADNVYFQVIGSAPNRELVVEWRNIRRFNCSPTSTATFQVVFFENSSNVLFNYLDTFFQASTCSGVNPNNGGSATVGVQIIPISGFATQFSINSQSLSNNMALLWTFPLLENPVPSLNSLNPNSKTAGSPAFTLTVNGSGFVNSSVVRWNGADRTTTFVNSGQVTATISAADVAAPGLVDVTVFNPEPAGGTSNALSFSISGAAPFISSIQPNSLPATGPDFTLTVNGTGFANNAVARWNGVDKMTTFINSTKLEALIPASDIAVSGLATVRVFNPPPGGGLSNSASFTISLRNPLPTVTGLTPPGVLTGSGALTLSVSGSNFVPSSVVRWNGSDRTTTFMSSGLLQAAIPAGDVSSPGTADVTVFSPGPGGGTSNAKMFSIQNIPNAAPMTSSLSPSFVTAGTIRDSLTVQVDGMNFTPASVVRWNGSNRATMFVSANRVDATIPASDLVAVGTAQVRVFTPVPGGGTSNVQIFTINNPSPTLTAISPSSTPPGSPEMVLIVLGSNFVPGSVVRWNGANLSTTFIGSNQLRATVPAANLANMGSAMVTVSTPSPGGGTSSAQTFNITP